MTTKTRTSPSTPAGCTALRFRKAARRVSQIYDQFLEPYGLSITQFGLLAHIRRLEGISIGALASELVMDPTTLTRNLQPLRKRGLILDEPSKTDKRTRVLKLSPAGRAAVIAAMPGWEKAQEQIAEVLGADHAPLSTAIDHMLTRLAD